MPSNWFLSFKAVVQSWDIGLEKHFDAQSSHSVYFKFLKLFKKSGDS